VIATAYSGSVAGVVDTDVIDLVAQDGDGRFLAVMIEDRPWGSDPEQLTQLREKFNSYFTFIALGGYVEQVPRAAGRPITIQLRCGAPPEGEIAALLAETERLLVSQGIGFELKLVDYL
jgi:hypothetical protein